MKKKLILAAITAASLLGMAAPALAGNPNAWVWTVNDPEGTPYTFELDDEYFPDDPRILILAPTTNMPYLASFAGGIKYVDGAVEVSDVPIAEITGLQANLDSLSSGKANVSHFHSTSDINGLGSFVDARMASSSATSTPIGVQRTRVQTNSSGVYTWTFPTAYPASSTPVVMVTAEDGTANVMTNAQITSISNTAVTVQVNQIAQVNLLSTLLGTGPVAVQKFVDITAVKP